MRQKELKGSFFKLSNIMNLLDYYSGDVLCADVWKGKYAMKNKMGRLMEGTPDDMHARMARELSKAEINYIGSSDRFGDLSEFGKKLSILSTEQIYDYLSHFKYIIPQGSIMTMLGNHYTVGSLSNCFVIPPPMDSYGGIFTTDQQIAQLEKRRGGVGTNINTLRPENTSVMNAAGTSTGAHSFMDRFSNTTREVAQNGRRGALMLLMSCKHPDIFKFVSKKADLTKVTGANISSMLTDEFMKAALESQDFICTFPINAPVPVAFNQHAMEYNTLYVLNDGFMVPGGYIGDNDTMAVKIRAKELLDLIVEMAWSNGEPGLAFIDTIINYSPEGVYPQYRPIASNPCGEQWMQAYDACRLLALNLFNVVDNPFLNIAKLNEDKLYEIAYIQQRLGDDIVDLEIQHCDRIIDKIKKDPEPAEIKATELNLWKNIKATAEASRRTGCGFTAMADMIAAMGFKYDSPESLQLIEKVMKIKMRAELDCSIDMAIVRGAFTGWDPDLEFKDSIGQNDFYKMMSSEFPEQVIRMIKFGRRNCSWSTVAPTGTVSIVAKLIKFANTSAGVEPVFLTHHERNKKVNPSDNNVRVDFVDQNGDSWMTYPVVMAGLKEWIRITHKEADFVGIDNLPTAAIDEFFKKSPYFGSCANDISWEKRVEIQSIVQKYTTNAISSTLNLPNDVSKEVVASIYEHAWRKGLKGVTVYRDGCRTGVLVKENKKEGFQYKDAVKRPKDLKCSIFTTVAKGTKWNVIVGLLDDKPYEVFSVPHFTDESEMVLRKAGKGKYNLIKDGDVYQGDITSQMNDEESALTRMISTSLRHGCDVEFIVEQLNKSHGTIVSFSKAISRNLSKFVKKQELKGDCPECGGVLRKEEGCTKCTSCSYSKC